MPLRLSPATDLADPALAARWQARWQAHWQAGAPAAVASPFLSWTWVGCDAGARFTQPWLAEGPSGAALLNRVGHTLYLHETGDPVRDAVFVEHNGALGGPEAFADLLDAVRPAARRLVLSGIDDAALAAVRAAGGLVLGLQTRAAPFATLRPDTAHLEHLSRNTRAQLRRSDRAYAGSGPVRAERAEDLPTARAWFAQLVALHRATWSARGIPSGFLSGPVQRFHDELLARGVPTGEVDLIRVSAGPVPIGYLMNLRAGHRAFAYQSGLDYAGAPPYGKPGFTSHHAAIELARAAGLTEYDFLAGDSRYKRSLSTGSRNLHWLTWVPRPAFFGLEGPARRMLAWMRNQRPD